MFLWCRQIGRVLCLEELSRHFCRIAQGSNGWNDSDRGQKREGMSTSLIHCDRLECQYKHMQTKGYIYVCVYTSRISYVLVFDADLLMSFAFSIEATDFRTRFCL